MTHRIRLSIPGLAAISVAAFVQASAWAQRSDIPSLQMPPAQTFKPLQPSSAAPEGERRAVMLQGLDKVTTRTRRFPAAIGETVEFGTLRITASECLVNVPEAPAEAAAYLTIVDNKPGQAPETLFTGWMFASSPGLSGLDSSVYDVWVVACANIAQASAPSMSR